MGSQCYVRMEFGVTVLYERGVMVLSKMNFRVMVLPENVKNRIYALHHLMVSWGEVEVAALNELILRSRC